MAIHWSRQLEIQKSLDCPEPLCRRTQVLRSLDLALGPLFRRALLYCQAVIHTQSVVDHLRDSNDPQ